MTLRETARQLVRIASEVRDTAARLEPRAARDVRALAYDIERHAGRAERIGRTCGEPDPAERIPVVAGLDPRAFWPVDHESGE